MLHRGNLVADSALLEMSRSLATVVVRRLHDAHYVICTVESCTGGLVSNLITNTEGSSKVFWGAFVTYDNSAKANLGVSSRTLEEFGPVSAECAREMAETGLKRLRDCPTRKVSATLVVPHELLCVSVTGFAGLGGGTPENPVGTCYFGLASSTQCTRVERFQGTGTDREHLKLQFATRALEMLANMSIDA